MKNNVLIVYLICLFFFSGACKKDDPELVVHSGLTRINYVIDNPQEMPHIEFTLDTTYNLEGRTFASLSIITNENSSSLSLIVMLEDEEGNMTDQEPFVISEGRMARDNRLHTYTYDFENKLGSSANSTDGVDINHIKKIRIYINAGTEGEAAEGIFWLDKIAFKTAG